MNLMHIFDAALIIIPIAVGIGRCMQKFEKHILEVRRLEEQWLEARRRRLHWKRSHYHNFDFSDQEYQRLYEREISAEEQFVMTEERGIKKTFRGLTSLNEYLHDQEIATP